MPNWCYNAVTMSHDDTSKIDALEKVLQDEKGEPFQHLRPNPTGEWDYGWSCENWGTKWDVSVQDWERDGDNTITMNFDSAWSPPVTLYEYLESEGWSVRAMYHEPGMGFAGKFEDGYDDYYDYDYTDRDQVENLPEDILDFTNAMDDLENWEAEQEEEALSELERTEWFDASVNPAHIGRYEVETAAWPYPQYSNWDGEKWGRWEDDDAVITRWRGLIEEQWDAAAELQKIVDGFKA